MNYEELVKALRSASTVSTACEKLMLDAAAAIEELRKVNRELREMYEDAVRKLPNRGKWIVHTEVKNIYGGICIECPVCRDHFVVLNVSDEKYCRSCGAKMEVQE